MNIPKPNYDSPAEHSIYSPSGSKRWIQCPASISVIQELDRPQGESNFFAEEGTAAHELCEHCLTEELDASEVIGLYFGKFLVDKEMARQCQVYIDYVNGSVSWDATLWVENRLSLEYLQEGMFGTADAIVVSERELEVIDLKYGRGIVVEPEDNTQLMIYTLGVLKHLEVNGITFPDNFDVKMTIVQPRAPHESGPIRFTYMTIAQLRDFESMLKEAIVKTKEDNPPFGPSEEGCRWCEFAPICKPYAEYNLEMAKLEFADFELPVKKLKSKLMEDNSYTMEEAIKIMEHAKGIEQWVKSISGFVMEQLKQDKKVPGYKLVYGRSNRAWTNITEVERLLEDYGSDMDRFNVIKFMTPPQAEKECTEAEWKMLQDYVHKPQGKITIAKESDGRSAVNAGQEAVDDWAKEDL